MRKKLKKQSIKMKKHTKKQQKQSEPWNRKGGGNIVTQN